MPSYDLSMTGQGEAHRIGVVTEGSIIMIICMTLRTTDSAHKKWTTLTSALLGSDPGDVERLIADPAGKESLFMCHIDSKQSPDPVSRSHTCYVRLVITVCILRSCQLRSLFSELDVCGRTDPSDILPLFIPV